MGKTICVVTGTRAEYGILRPLLGLLRDAPDFTLQVIACAAHLSPEFGLTYREIEADGFQIAAKIDMLLSADTAVAVAKSIGIGGIGFADALDRLRPDFVVLLGDRFELLAAAQAALVLRIPIAHISGGETTEGAIDDSIRHALTKMAHLHFCATEPYRRRVIQMGEHPDRVFTVGALGLDNLSVLQRRSREEMESDLGIALGPPSALVTYHPATLDAEAPEDRLRALLAALDHFGDLHMVITYPNADPGGRSLIPLIEAFEAARPGRVRCVRNLGTARYFSMLALASVVVGNSSSGLIEAPSFHIPTVNLGDRQKGRIRAPSVIDVAETEAAITAGLTLALSPGFRDGLADMVNPYGDGRTAQRILDRLRATDPSAILVKRFYDLDFDGIPTP